MVKASEDYPPEEIGLLKDIEKSILIRYIDDLNAAILLDGFDELATQPLRESVIDDITYLSQSLKQSRLIITSRSSDFRYKLADIQKFEIAPLTHDQISDFALRWLPSEKQARDFLQKVFASPFADTTVRPLTIAHLCAIYERIQDIPEKPKSVYKRIVQLLLEEWDSQRNIRRPSSYAKFDHDRKFEFLTHLAFFMTTELQELRFSNDSLNFAYSKIHLDHGLPSKESKKVIAEIESHSGLIVESGRGYFEFAHKSIQEYLAADYIVRLPTLEHIETKTHLLPNELAIATSLSSRPCAFLAEMFLKFVDLERESTPWLQTFLSRLTIEKPELNVGASELSAIAAIHILSRLENPAHVITLLRGAFPSDTIKKISHHYSVAGRDLKNVSFRRATTLKNYRLPDHLTLPTDLFATIP